MSDIRQLIDRMPVHDRWPVRVVVGTFALVFVLIASVMSILALRAVQIDADLKGLALLVGGYLAGVLSRTSTTATPAPSEPVE